MWRLGFFGVGISSTSLPRGEVGRPAPRPEQILGAIFSPLSYSHVCSHCDCDAIFLPDATAFELAQAHRLGRISPGRRSMPKTDGNGAARCAAAGAPHKNLQKTNQWRRRAAKRSLGQLFEKDAPSADDLAVCREVIKSHRKSSAGSQALDPQQLSAWPHTPFGQLGPLRRHQRSSKVIRVLMAIGVWPHLTERHEHEHSHEPMEHAHPHVHAEHHRHSHAADDPPGGDRPAPCAIILQCGGATCVTGVHVQTAGRPSRGGTF